MNATMVPYAQKMSENALRLNAICPYYTMFPIDFPLEQLAAKPDTTRVLDPFCGRGTTLYAARLLGIPSVGIDINPVAVAITQAKLTQVTPQAVIRLARQILRTEEHDNVPTGEFWQWCYERETLREIVTLRTRLMSLATPTAAMLRAVILGILHGPQNKGLPSYLSNQMPRTYASKPAYAVKFWKTRNMTPVRIPTLDVITRRVNRLLEASPIASGGRVHLGDSVEKLGELQQKFDLVVTSPPYYGMRTYVADQWLRSWFIGGPSEVAYGTNGQIARQPNKDSFIQALADVWSATARRCKPNARLAIRFGAIPSARTDPEEMISETIARSEAAWEIKDIRPAGISPKRARQAEQFGRAGSAIDEVDIVAELTGRRSRTLGAQEVLDIRT
ncbi:DNA methyltransferase [Actinophytocola algeriensis]|uniref:site-specific DNA-methyltransferase (cytosine-N(4)-specific) n=1 Tax=Actinophytocola algeriensis TaxID=1768010 RepID=A0A7W7PZE4_9PSEU|nr:DNA methyltransferase [Actinophytocola algeriensis]MBB4904001.1 SAM-dependent methyltransferase [Actinophytocola algeriensis]MBE1477142.1 SAM-dependent methyltransferase [Actinophytocola algeriensis]